MVILNVFIFYLREIWENAISFGVFVCNLFNKEILLRIKQFINQHQHLHWNKTHSYIQIDTNCFLVQQLILQLILFPHHFFTNVFTWARWLDASSWLIAKLSIIDLFPDGPDFFAEFTDFLALRLTVAVEEALVGDEPVCVDWVICVVFSDEFCNSVGVVVHALQCGEETLVCVDCVVLSGEISHWNVCVDIDVPVTMTGDCESDVCVIASLVVGESVCVPWHSWYCHQHLGLTVFVSTTSSVFSTCKDWKK